MSHYAEDIISGLKKIGFDETVAGRLDPQKSKSLSLARVITVHRDGYIIANGNSEMPAELIGNLVYRADSPLDFPTVGDWVYAQFHDEDSLGIIHEVLPRTSLLKRKTAGKRVDIQLIAANVDVAFIVQSVDDNFNLRRMERYLTIARDSKIHPIVLLSKSDLISVVALERKMSEITAIMPDVVMQPFSSESGDGLERVVGFLTPGKTHCLLGSSGVGKTTLLNRLIGKRTFYTKDVRQKDSKGRHATNYRLLIVLQGGALLIDSPGMRELGVFAAEAGLAETFDEITALVKQCRFRDCTHTSETGCALRGAIEDGVIPKERYENYLKMCRESSFNDMTYLEKRKKDRQFGKMIKTVMKHKKSPSK